MQANGSNVRECEIVLVEDDAAEAELVLLTLRQTCPAARVVVLGDGDDLLEYLQSGDGNGRVAERRALRLVLLDLKLIRVHGLEALRQLKNARGTRAAPVVILTSSSLDADVRTAYELGANSYVVKPMEFNAFRRAVEDVAHYWLEVNQAPGP